LKRWFQSRRFRWATGLLCAALAVIVTGFFALPWLLLAPAETPPSDVILHYAIDPSTNADEYVAHLYRQNVAKKIVCISKASLCEIYPADYTRQHLIELGVPAEDVLTLHLPYDECVAQNLPYFTKKVKAHGWQRALLVLRPPFSRTEGNLAKKIFGQEGLPLAVTYSPNERQKFTTLWWTDHKTAQLTMDATVNFVLDQLYPACR
jgi:uncharacterized SAM-binding protein YcdF (DUF218 family)